MTIYNDYLLNIDSNNSDYQFIHLDVKHQYGIACKFAFEKKDPNNFQITHIKCVSYNQLIDSSVEYVVEIIKKTRKVSQKEFDYQIDLKLTLDIGTETDFETNEHASTTDAELGKYKHRCKRKNKQRPGKEYKIDVHIPNKPFSLSTSNAPYVKQLLELQSVNEKELSTNKPFTTFGNQFCKFVID